MSVRSARNLLRRVCTKPPSTPSPPPTSSSSGVGPRRFYDQVSVRVSSDDGYSILLDSKPIRTSTEHVLTAPTHALAVAVAAEWDAQTEYLRSSSMPLTRLVSAAQDVASRAEERTRMIKGLMRYLETDATCLRAERPMSLVEREEEVYGVFVRKMEELGVELRVVRGGLIGGQSEQTREKVGEIVGELGNVELVGVESVAGVAKSVVVGIGMVKGVKVEEVVRAARCEEEWQREVWGRVSEGGHELDEMEVEMRIRAVDVAVRLSKET